MILIYFISSSLKYLLLINMFCDKVKPWQVNKHWSTGWWMTCSCSLNLIRMLPAEILSEIFKSLVKIEMIFNHFNLFHITCLFFYLLKTPESPWFSDVFRGYSRRLVAWNGLMPLFPSYRDHFIDLQCKSIERFLYEMLCAIWYHFYNFKNVKNAHGGVLLLVSKVEGFSVQLC